MGRVTAVTDARAEGGTRAPVRRRRDSMGRGRLSPGGGSGTTVVSLAEIVGNKMAFSPPCEGSRGIDESGFDVRSAVVLVRATVAEAFRDGKREGGPQSDFRGLLVDCLRGTVFVLSPNARKVVTIGLELKASGAVISV